MLDGGLNVAVSPFELIAIKRNFAGRILKFAGVQFVVGPCGGHARKDGRTGFSRAAPATLQCLRWPYWVLKRSACRASTFKMAVLCSQALHLPHFNLYDGRTEFSSAAPAALQL